MMGKLKLEFYFSTSRLGGVVGWEVKIKMSISPGGKMVDLLTKSVYSRTICLLSFSKKSANTSQIPVCGS